MVRYLKIHERWRTLISHLGECSVSNSESCWVVLASQTNSFSLLNKEWGNLPFLLFYKALPPSWQATGCDETDSLDLKRPISQVTPVLSQKQAHSSAMKSQPIYRSICVAEEIRYYRINITNMCTNLWLDPEIYWIKKKLGKYAISVAQWWRLKTSMHPQSGILSPTWGTPW